jgi:hypothetical protein
VEDGIEVIDVLLEYGLVGHAEHQADRLHLPWIDVRAGTRDALDDGLGRVAALDPGNDEVEGDGGPQGEQEEERFPSEVDHGLAPGQAGVESPLPVTHAGGVPLRLARRARFR